MEQDYLWSCVGNWTAEYVWATCCEDSEPRPAALCKMRVLGAFYLVTAGHFPLSSRSKATMIFTDSWPIPIYLERLQAHLIHYLQLNCKLLHTLVFVVLWKESKLSLTIHLKNMPIAANPENLPHLKNLSPEELEQMWEEDRRTIAEDKEAVEQDIDFKNRKKVGYPLKKEERKWR